MIEEHEPCLHALEVEPRSARSGDVVTFTLRLRNRGSRAAESATARLILAPGLEPLGEREMALGGAVPGEELQAAFRAQIGTCLDDRTGLWAYARIVLPEGEIPTNRCVVRVRTTPRFDGTRSGARVERVDAETVRVVATATNEGDGPAHDVRLTLRPPAGCAQLDDERDKPVRAARLAPGALLCAELRARIVAPQATLTADQCEVTSRNGGRCGLPARGALVLAAAVADPELQLVPGRSHVAVRALIRNEGWIDARDVPVSIALPPVLRMGDATIDVDGVRYPLRAARAAAGAPVRIIQKRAPLALVLARVPARSSSELAFTLACPPGCDPQTIEVCAAERRTTAVVAMPLTRDVRIRLIDVPPRFEPGGSAQITIELFNAGDTSLELSVAFEGTHAKADTVRVYAHARTLQLVPLQITVGALERVVSERLECAIVVSDGDDTCARLEVTLLLGERPRLVADHDAAVEVAPREPAATLDAPAEAMYGAPFRVRVRLEVHDAVEALALRIDAGASARYIPGSTTVDGRALAEDPGAALFERGLHFRRIAGGTRIDVGCALLALGLAPADAVTISGVLRFDDEDRRLEPLRVPIRARDPYAPGFVTPAYALDAILVDDAGEVPAPPVRVAPVPIPVPPPEGAVVAFRPDWHAATRRLLQPYDEPGLLPHILALRALFPDRELGGDPALRAALDAAREALRDVFDRLFVKARIPGFGVAADDIEDASLRPALRALFETLTEAGPGRAPRDGVWRRIDREQARWALEVLSAAPLGAPAALRTLTLLIPTQSDDDDAATALARYVDELDGALRAAAEGPLDAFDRALTSGRYTALDAARASLAAAVAARASRAAPW